MEPVRIDNGKFKIKNLINYYNDNVREMLCECSNSVTRVNLIDKDYLDVIVFDEDYEEVNEASDYEEKLVDEEYSLLFIIGKTHEGLDKFEFIDGTKYIMKHYAGDIYSEEKSIKDIGDLSIDLDHYIGMLIDFADNEYIISLVNYEKGMAPSISEVEDSGDIEDIAKELIDKFTV